MAFHILHIPRWYPHKKDAMLGLFVKNQLRSLGVEYLNSVLFIHFVERQEKTYIIEIEPGDRIHEYRYFVRKSITSPKIVGSFINACRYLRASAKGYKLIREQHGRPHLCHVHVLTRSGLVALWLKYFYGLHYVVTEHWSRYFPEHNAFKGWWRKMLARLIVRKSSGLICVSESLHMALKGHKLDHKNYLTVPNAVDPRFFNPGVERKPSEFTWLIHISCFEDKSKNISGLLRAMKLLALKNVGVRLKLVGDGIDKDYLQKLATELELNNIVSFTGTLQHDELVTALHLSDFLVQTSHYETFSTVVAESFACGIPVISTPVGIFPEVLEPETGLLIPTVSPEAIANAIIQAISGKDKFNCEKMRKIAGSRFSNEPVGNLLMSFYQQVIQDAKR